MNEVVKYQNQLNATPLRNFKAVDLDFLMLLCHKFREKGTETIQFDLTEIKELSNYKFTGQDRFIKDLVGMNKKLLNCDFIFRDENKIVQFVLFTKFEIDSNRETLTVRVNDEFAFLLNDLGREFTRFELDEFVHIKSSYAKECYRRLKQYRTTGEWIVKLDEFRRLLDIPDSYKMSDIDTRVLKPIKEELSPLFSNFKITKIKKRGRGRGGVVDKLEFKFDKEIIISKSNNVDSDKYYEPKSIGRNCPQCGKPLYELFHNGSVFYGHYFHQQGEECKAKFKTVAEIDGIDETPRRIEEDRKPCPLPPDLQERLDNWNKKNSKI